MEIITTPIKDLIIIKPDVFHDARGYFTETYNKEKYFANGILNNFVQDNMSKSSYGTVRGLHNQKGEFSQAKLVSVVVGKVWDIAVDLRQNSETFGKWYGVELSDENHLQFLVPRGFFHGFSVLSDTAIFTYKCDNFYEKNAELSIIYNDKDLNVDWKIPAEKMLVSEKDKLNQCFQEFLKTI
ncbi:MAG: dTDP-4-dehydrorhamnose 3,5-epimerase [Prevotellaceae bacterium]|jgi:dTDP-4-dehydrorhamnose 3,5-epimerase|nr:dTDP-4-dehydrorhamnose 3,5-epimerase [Prevotellaceae bacterium]